MRTILTATVAVVLLAAGAVRAGEEKIDVDKLPKAVLAAVKARFPDAKLNGASKETEDGKTTYEVSLEFKKQKMDVILTPDGKITTIEKEIAAKDLPKAVSAALEKKYPKATYKVVEEVIKVTGDKEALDFYEVLLITEGKKTFEVVISPEGKITKEEDKSKEKEEKKDK